MEAVFQLLESCWGGPTARGSQALPAPRGLEGESTRVLSPAPARSSFLLQVPGVQPRPLVPESQRIPLLQPYCSSPWIPASPAAPAAASAPVPAGSGGSPAPAVSLPHSVHSSLPPFSTGDTKHITQSSSSSQPCCHSVALSLLKKGPSSCLEISCLLILGVSAATPWPRWGLG